MRICNTCVYAKTRQKISENSSVFMILGGLGASGADLAKKVENVPKIYGGSFSILGVIFDNYRQKVGIRKSTVFRTLHFRPKIGPEAPKVGIMADPGPEKLRKWSPK